jgi:peroxiredoxin Q/BCP
MGVLRPLRRPDSKRKALRKPKRKPLGPRVLSRLEHAAPNQQNERAKTTKGRHMPAKSATETLTIGAKGPSFKLPADDGGMVSLGDFKGKKLVIFFYPRADTPGCTKESIDFSKHKSAFSRANTAVLGVSADPAKAQSKFKQKHDLTVSLGSDETTEMLAAYGAWGEKSLYGRKFMGVIRSTVLIGEDGRIAQVWPKVKVDGHAEEVLAAAKAL